MLGMAKKRGRPPKPNKTETVFARIDADVYADFEKFVEEYADDNRLRVSQGAHVERAIREYMEKYRKKPDGGDE